MGDCDGGQFKERTYAPISALLSQLSALESLRTVEPFVSAISTLEAQQRHKSRRWKRPSHAPEPNNLFMYENFVKDFELDESASFLTRLQRYDYLPVAYRSVH